MKYLKGAEQILIVTENGTGVLDISFQNPASFQQAGH